MQQNLHIDRVTQTVMSSSAKGLAASWRRSMMSYALDPSERHRHARLTERETNKRRAFAHAMCEVANPLMDHLFNLVCASGCGVFLTDHDGVVLEQRCSSGDVLAFQDWNLWSGARWSEDVEGTNGIGTCLAEGRRLVIHRDEHFATRNTGMSCIDAPIHDQNGALVGALDVSSARSDQSAPLNRLMFEAVTQTARQIEADLFRSAFESCRLVVATADGSALLAVDSDDVVVGANRAARKLFDLPKTGPLDACPATDLLQDTPERRGFDRGEHAAIKRALLRHGGNASAAARALGIGRATLYRRAKRLGIMTDGT